MIDRKKTLKKYLQLLETFTFDRKELAKVLHPEVTQIEYPNLVTKTGQERGFDGCAKGLEMGSRLLAEQKFDVRNQLENGDHLAVEAVWTGTMAVDAGPFRKGQTLKAFFCMVFEFKDGKIFRQRNYDCYEPF